MRYFIFSPDDNSGRARIKDENGRLYCRASLVKAREICKNLNKKKE